MEVSAIGRRSQRWSGSAHRQGFQVGSGAFTILYETEWFSDTGESFRNLFAFLAMPFRQDSAASYECSAVVCHM